MKSLQRVRKRHGRCYELAFRAMLDEPGAEKFTLIHGRIGPGIDHAWIDVGDGRIYDPVSNAYTPADEYMRSALAERRYSKAQTMEMIRAERHCGPWHVSPLWDAVLNSPEGIAWRAKMAKIKKTRRGKRRRA